MNLLRLKLHKLLHWEYWSDGWIYYPILPFWIYYAIRAKSFFFFNAANPTMKNGGMAMESKKEIYDLIPVVHIPKTLLFSQPITAIEIVSEATVKSILFPFIIKPDIGLKGWGVEIINSVNDLEKYLKIAEGNLLVQEYIKHSNEVGIFYCRIPGDPAGKITGIVQKEFLSVTGNGTSTLLELIQEKPRCMNQLPTLRKLHSEQFNSILPDGEKLILIPYGSHTRGSLFTDISSKLNPNLYNIINNICKNINGFYFGRMDVMFSSWEELCIGKNFSIIELNGAGSEPTHIFDPKHSIFFGWKEIVRHWRLLYQISMINKKNGHPFLNYKEGMEMIKENGLLEKRLSVL